MLSSLKARRYISMSTGEEPCGTIRTLLAAFCRSLKRRRAASCKSLGVIDKRIFVLAKTSFASMRKSSRKKAEAPLSFGAFGKIESE